MENAAQEITQELERGTENNKWINSHMNQLRDSYGGKFIAVEDQSVVVSSTDRDEIVEKVQEEASHPQSAIITFVYEEGKKILR